MGKRFLAGIIFLGIVIFGLFSGVKTASGIKKLCSAIEAGDNEEAIRLAGKIRELNAQSSCIPRLARLFEGEVTTPLVKACETGNAEMIICLLEHGARPDYAPGDITYPLEAFCYNGSGAGPDALCRLLDNGADPEQYKYRPPLFLLAETLRHRSDRTYPAGVDMVLLLLEKGAGWQDPSDGLNILHYAAMQRNGELLKALLKKEEAAKYLNMKSSTGETPLDFAKTEECADILLDAGAYHGTSPAGMMEKQLQAGSERITRRYAPVTMIPVRIQDAG